MEQVLIIDDDDRNIYALTAVLVSKGFQCLTAASGAKALEILGGNRQISIALVDMMMPAMDGYELIEKIRMDASLGHLRLIAVTARAMPGDREKCIAAGADGYISKPVDIKRLIAEMDPPSTRQI